MSPLARSLFRHAIMDHLLAEIYRISEQDQTIQPDVHLTICKLNQYLLKQGSMISIQDLRDLESKNFQVAQNFMRIARSLQPLVSDKDRKASHKEEDRKATYKKTAKFAESMLELMSKKETRGEALASSKPKRARLDELEAQMSHFDA